MTTSRRQFLQKTIVGTAGLIGFPTIVPASVLGPNAPSNRINIGAIGTGRIAREHDMPGVLQYGDARIVAVCDVDSKRAGDAKKLVNDYYARKTGKAYDGVKMYDDYLELLTSKEIDAVLISTPDHWHAKMTIDAVRAGKDVYMQKPASVYIAEGRKMSDAVQQSGRILQVGSQQRSMPQFRRACELVRNGRIGKLHTIQIGIGSDPAGEVAQTMPIPATLNFDRWLGPVAQTYYHEKRVHPQTDYSRPGWMRCDQFSAGMITNWGAHHVDIAHWAMGTELTGPLEVSGQAEYPREGIWDVHGKFRTESRYANGVTVIIASDFPNGVRFEGSDGWIWVTRGNYSVTASDPVKTGNTVKALDASNSKLLTSDTGENETHLHKSEEHHRDWLDSVKSRKQPIAPVEVGHRTCSACLVNLTAMKLGRKLTWDPQTERFMGDNEANAMLSRPQRAPYTF